MTPIDRLLQKWRIAKARPYIADGARVLDIGCADGALLREVAGRISEGLGIDPTLTGPSTFGPCKLIPGTFPQDFPDTDPLDVIVALAVVEHLPHATQSAMAGACYRALRPG